MRVGKPIDPDGVDKMSGGRKGSIQSLSNNKRVYNYLKRGINKKFK